MGQGRLLPSTSVDQMATTLAMWMGLGKQTDGSPNVNALKLVVPSAGNYDAASLNLGIFA